MLFGALALRFSQPPGCGTKALVSNARRTACVPDGLYGLSVLQQFSFFYVFLRSREEKSVAKELHKRALLLHMSHTRLMKIIIFMRHIGCSWFSPKV